MTRHKTAYRKTKRLQMRIERFSNGFTVSSVNNLKKKWMPEELKRLQRGIILYGKDQIRAIARYVKTRSESSCFSRIKSLINKKLITRQFNPKDDRIILALYDIFSRKNDKNIWKSIEKYMYGRSAKQIKERYKNHLAVSTADWSNEEIKYILKAKPKATFSKIARQLHRSPHDIKRIYRKVIQFIPPEDFGYQDQEPLPIITTIKNQMDPQGMSTMQNMGAIQPHRVTVEQLDPSVKKFAKQYKYSSPYSYVGGKRTAFIENRCLSFTKEDDSSSSSDTSETGEKPTHALKDAEPLEAEIIPSISQFSPTNTYVKTLLKADLGPDPFLKEAKYDPGLEAIGTMSKLDKNPPLQKHPSTYSFDSSNHPHTYPRSYYRPSQAVTQSNSSQLNHDLKPSNTKDKSLSLDPLAPKIKLSKRKSQQDTEENPYAHPKRKSYRTSKSNSKAASPALIASDPLTSVDTSMRHNMNTMSSMLSEYPMYVSSVNEQGSPHGMSPYPMYMNSLSYDAPFVQLTANSRFPNVTKSSIPMSWEPPVRTSMYTPQGALPLPSSSMYSYAPTSMYYTQSYMNNYPYISSVQNTVSNTNPSYSCTSPLSIPMPLQAKSDPPKYHSLPSLQRNYSLSDPINQPRKYSSAPSMSKKTQVTIKKQEHDKPLKSSISAYNDPYITEAQNPITTRITSSTALSSNENTHKSDVPIKSIGSLQVPDVCVSTISNLESEPTVQSVTSSLKSKEKKLDTVESVSIHKTISSTPDNVDQKRLDYDSTDGTSIGSLFSDTVDQEFEEEKQNYQQKLNMMKPKQDICV